MTTPIGGYTEWGYLGGLIFIVVAFLSYLWRRDTASAKREKTQQDFFGKLLSASNIVTSDLVDVIRGLAQEFHIHDEKTTEAIATMKERTLSGAQPRKSQPRKP